MAKPSNNERALFAPGVAVDTEKLRIRRYELVPDESSPALEAIARFLQLRPNQIEDFLGLLQSRRSTVAPLLLELDEHEKQLNQLLESGGTPPDVGQVVIQVHSLQKQVLMAQNEFMANWQSTLDLEQAQRLGAVRLAAQLQPILPAFQQLALF